MIQVKDGVFLLKNENISYMFRATESGNLEHLHFGAPVDIDDWDAFANPLPYTR